MLMRIVTLAAGVGLVALMLPGLATRYIDHAEQYGAKQPQAASSPLQPASYATGSRDVILPSGQNGHFFGNFTINGRKANGLIDTGASMIAINVSAARRFGLSPATMDFSETAQTANGAVKVAYVTLDRVDIGGITVRDVGAAVLPDKALSGMLVGMSFLGKLSSYRVEGGALHLKP